MAFAGGAFALGMLAVRFLRSRSEPQRQPTSSPSSASYGNSVYGTPPRAGSTGSATTPGSAATPPGGSTAAAQEALNRATASRTTSPPRSGSASGASMNPGTPAAPGPGYGTSVPQSERPTPNPAATPVTSNTPAGAGSTTPTRAPGAQSGVSSSTSERTGAGGRNQS
jgi:hypothetical protein